MAMCWRSGWVGKISARKAWRPEFDSHNSKPDIGEYICCSSTSTKANRVHATVNSVSSWMVRTNTRNCPLTSTFASWCCVHVCSYVRPCSHILYMCPLTHCMHTIHSKNYADRFSEVPLSTVASIQTMLHWLWFVLTAWCLLEHQASAWILLP